MTICYVLPGLLGSQIGLPPNGSEALWVSYWRLAYGLVGWLRLDPAGDGPGPPDGRALVSAGPLDDYYGSTMRTLQQQLGPHGYAVHGWGFDWRRQVRKNGALLAATISSSVSADDPCSIVGHSIGGLVARAAWAALAADGKSDLVRRIVTIGTPHQGSYGPVALWSLRSDAADQLVLLTAFSQTIQAISVPLPGSRAWSLDDLCMLSATWPALYEVLPILGGSDAAEDPYRADVYGPGWPADRGVSSTWLAYAAGDWTTWLHSPASMPPPWVLTTAAGVGTSTFAILARPTSLGSVTALSSTYSGDGHVTQGSALVPESSQWTVAARHNDLPHVFASTGVLASQILEVRVPPAPPPPPRFVAPVLSQVLAGPPSPAVIVARSRPSSGPGDC